MDAAERFSALAHHDDPTNRQYFSADEPVFIASAPGRLDVVGGIADYSGSLVLQLPLDRTTVAMMQRHDARAEVFTRSGAGMAERGVMVRHVTW